MTLTEAALDAAKVLRSAGLSDDAARQEASLLARHVAGWDTARWLADSRSTPASPEFSSTFAGLIRRRAGREPLAYITGEREFYGRVFEVKPGVLIPRPETELIVDVVLEIAKGKTAPRILDIGTGSGCLAVTVSVELPTARTMATDSSEFAIDVARANARRFGVDARVSFRAGNLLAGSEGPFDIVISNPPYVSERDRAALEPEVSRYEPAAALFAGNDGLDVIRRLLPAAARVLAPDGKLVFEIGMGQAAEVEQIVNRRRRCDSYGSSDDLQSIPRVAVTSRSD